VNACERLNALSEEAARAAFAKCCGASRWVTGVVAARPFRDAQHLFAVAESVWHGLGPADWHEAFAHHPRIGERPAPGGSSAAWAKREQAGAEAASGATKSALVEVNRRYEARFGHIYLVCATGKSGEELLAMARARLANDPDTELRVAAAEQAKITRLRLEKLLAEGPA
jgi:2-oxo-4-hydroxy-4-carboxy-5-ureidoimidazoline decarboxylase